MKQTFRDLIAANKRNSLLLVLGFVLFCFIAVLLLALGIVAFLAPEVVSKLDWRTAALSGAIAAGVSLVLMLGA